MSRSRKGALGLHHLGISAAHRFTDRLGDSEYAKLTFPQLEAQDAITTAQGAGIMASQTMGVITALDLREEVSRV